MSDAHQLRRAGFTSGYREKATFPEKPQRGLPPIVTPRPERNPRHSCVTSVASPNGPFQGHKCDAMHGCRHLSCDNTLTQTHTLRRCDATHSFNNLVRACSCIERTSNTFKYSARLWDLTLFDLLSNIELHIKINSVDRREYHEMK